MCRRRKRANPAWALAACAAGLIGAPAFAQSPPPEALEAYLADRELYSVLAAHLRERLRAATGDERPRVAELLGRLYVRMLERAGTSEERQELEGYSRDLLKLVPESDSFELRINLAKVQYLQAEDIAERVRLRIARESDSAEAQRILRGVGATFEEIAGKVGVKVQGLERQETVAKDTEIEQARSALSEARRLRSLARYYSGWTEYYQALLTDTPQRAGKALEHFGWILNALPNRPPTIDRLPEGLLRYEHVARAAMGVALCHSLLGNENEAIRWMEAVEHADALPQAVKDQLFQRQLTVLARAKRWADIDLLVRRRRNPDKDKPPVPLLTGEARLLAVLALDAARNEQTRPGLRGAAEQLSQVAMADLISRGEVGHVLDLVEKFGTLPLGDEGFISAYVRGLQTFEKAREKHKASGGDPEAPTTSTELVNQYEEAARLLDSVDTAADASRFPGELVKARIRRGLALYYAGELELAAQQFQKAAEPPATREQRQDALWYAVVALDRAVENGMASVVGERDSVATLYLKEFPASPNAAKLLLRQVRADLVGEDKAIEILMGVPKDSPLYDAARRQAARLLYAAFRRSGAGTARDFAALRFVEVAERVLRAEAERATASKDRPGQEAADNAVVLVRQIADALLATTTPDIPRVEAALEVLDGVSAYQGMDLQRLGAELAFRRLQIAVARGDESQIQKRADELRAIGGAFSDAADRLLYVRSARAFEATPADVGAARSVVRFGARVLDATPRARESGDSTAASLRNTIARAASLLWEQEKDAPMRDLALELERAQYKAGVRTGEGLRRLGELAEGAGENQEALDAWRELLIGLDDSTPEWYEARYQTIRLLMSIDPPQAQDAMKQHKVLHPGYGPTPWGEKLRELDTRIQSGFAGPAKPAPTPGAPGGVK